MPIFNFTGMRADKIRVEPVPKYADVDDDPDEGYLVLRERGVNKHIKHSTISCDECDEDGYYDEKGDVICPECGLILAGGPDMSAVLPVDFTNNRGFTEMEGPSMVGPEEPSVNNANL